MQITHTFVSTVSDGSNATLVRPSNWNAAHTITGTANTLAGYNSSGAPQDVNVSTGLSLSGSALLCTVTEITGVVKMWLTTTAPTGYLLCDGSAVSRTTYAALFAVIGTAYGIGDGSTTFNVPDMRDSVGIGVSPGSLSGRPTLRTIGQSGGEETHVLITTELAAHTHTYNLATAGSYVSINTSNAGNSALNGLFNVAQNTGSTGSGTAHNNMQPFVVVNYIVKT